MSNDAEFRAAVAATLARIEEKLEHFPCQAHEERMTRIEGRLDFLTRTLLLTSISAVLATAGYVAKLVLGGWR